MYIADGDYIKDIEINDLRNKYTLTKGATQKMVNLLVISTDSSRHSSPRSEPHGPSFFPHVLVKENLKLTLATQYF